MAAGRRHPKDRRATNTSYAKFHQDGTNGRREASSRNQPVNKRGKFQSKAKAAKRKAGAVGFRELKFEQGGGKIPARPFLPEDGKPLPARWDAGIARVITDEIERFTSRF